MIIFENKYFIQVNEDKLNKFQQVLQDNIFSKDTVTKLSNELFFLIRFAHYIKENGELEPCLLSVGDIDHKFFKLKYGHKVNGRIKDKHVIFKLNVQTENGAQLQFVFDNLAGKYAEVETFRLN